MNPRTIVKFIVNNLVYATANAAVERGITEANPDFAEDHNWITSIAAGTIGSTVQDVTKPATDKLVDNVFDKIKSRKAKKTN
jgi:hypothetical protein